MVLGFDAIDQVPDKKLYKMRRNELARSVRDQFPDKEEGLIIIFAGFENDRVRFCQDSSFFYLTGISEPGVVLTVDLTGKSILYIPCFSQSCRAQWTGVSLSVSEEGALKNGVDEIKELGNIAKGYKACGYPSCDEYKGLLEVLVQQKKKQGTIFSLCPQNAAFYSWQRLLLGHVNSMMSGLSEMLVDISPIIENMRRRKDLYEIEQLYKAVEITMLAQEAAAQAIMPEINEHEVQASLEYMITGSGAACAFPSIVAGGKNGTVLHYTENSSALKGGELVIVDIGAEYNHYCGDITRTYPVSGKFTKRQRQLYEIVLKTQEYIASIAKPGYWLCNGDEPEKSLHHLAQSFLKDVGYEKYMVHGIGHFLGLDVHDVGDVKKPLAENDIITIEPGLYLPEENIGIRIEDDYWIAKDGAICLSEGLAKKPDEIELLVQQNFSHEPVDIDMHLFKGSDFSEDEVDA